MSLEVSHLSSQDAIVALRSYPRRFAEALAPRPGDGVDVEELADRVDPSGRSARDHLTDAARTLALINRALHDTVYHDQPVLHEAVMDPAARRWDGPAESLSDLLVQLGDEATALADAAGQTSHRDWSRSATVAGGRTVTALDLVREAVRCCSDDLHGVEARLTAARR